MKSVERRQTNKHTYRVKTKETLSTVKLFFSIFRLKKRFPTVMTKNDAETCRIFSHTNTYYHPKVLDI